MKRVILTGAALLMMTAGLGSSPALALGPVDGKVGVFWWDNDFSVDGETGLNADSAGDVGGFAELWLVKRLGFRAEMLRSDVGDVGGGADQVEMKHLDVMFRLFSFGENNYLALGAGWQQADLGLGPEWGDTSGARVMATGGFGIVGILTGYAELAWMPGLDDIDPAAASGGVLADVEGKRWEIGLALKPWPFMQFRAGFHHAEFDMRREGVTTPHDVSTEAEGWLAGVAFTF